MTEVDLQLREQIDKQYRLLGFESYEDGHEELDQEVGGVLERLPQHQKAPDFSPGMNDLFGLSVRGFPSTIRYGTGASDTREKPRALARGGSPAEVRDYLDRRTAHIEDRKDRRSVIKLLELRMSALRMQKEG